MLMSWNADRGHPGIAYSDQSDGIAGTLGHLQQPFQLVAMTEPWLVF